MGDSSTSNRRLPSLGRSVYGASSVALMTAMTRVWPSVTVAALLSRVNCAGVGVGAGVGPRGRLGAGALQRARRLRMPPHPGDASPYPGLSCSPTSPAGGAPAACARRCAAPPWRPAAGMRVHAIKPGESSPWPQAAPAVGWPLQAGTCRMNARSFVDMKVSAFRCIAPRRDSRTRPLRHWLPALEC
jgi:hypothetical protein